MESKHRDTSQTSEPTKKTLIPRALQPQQPRPANFRMSEPVLKVAPRGQVELAAPEDSRVVFVFLDTEHLDGNDRHAPFGVKTLDLPAGERRTLRADFGVEGGEYRYISYLVDRDDLADGNSPPRIHVVAF